MIGGNECRIHIFRDRGVPPDQFCLLCVRQKVRAVIHRQSPGSRCADRGQERKGQHDRNQGHDYFFHFQINILPAQGWAEGVHDPGGQ